MILVKVNGAEACEMKRFQNFAQDDLRKCLKKKKMKAAVPLGAQFLYLGGFSLFCVASHLITPGTIAGSMMVSFVMCMFLLVEPIQVLTASRVEKNLIAFEKSKILSSTVVPIHFLFLKCAKIFILCPLLLLFRFI